MIGGVATFLGVLDLGDITNKLLFATNVMNYCAYKKFLLFLSQKIDHEQGKGHYDTDGNHKAHEQ